MGVSASCCHYQASCVRYIHVKVISTQAKGGQPTALASYMSAQHFFIVGVKHVITVQESTAGPSEVSPHAEALGKEPSVKTSLGPAVFSRTTMTCLTPIKQQAAGTKDGAAPL